MNENFKKVVSEFIDFNEAEWLLFSESMIIKHYKKGEYFLEEGIFNKEVATKFKENVLSKGGTEKPMELYKRFRGKEPKPDALLKRAGLI